ncbi:hypothetical protein [Halosegnis marinus]|uniref:MFS transporter n=1 Tax=Halosegnis marinus TaxID=3034023 RepID=A0ABD5ZM87_9EURY|nr:hypothetical protein [Halosegnis sp. DT85]
MEPFRSAHSPPEALLAVACLLAGLGFGITGLSLFADAAAGSLSTADARALAALAPAVVGAVLTTTGGWLFGRLP